MSTFTGFGVDAGVRADPGGTFAAMIDRHAIESRLAPALYHERLEHRFQTIYTLFVPLIALCYGGAIGLLHWRRKPWIVPLVGGIQHLCFIYLFLGAAWAAASAVGMNPFGLSPMQIVVIVVVLLVT